jgi:hypothetical protein
MEQSMKKLGSVLAVAVLLVLAAALPGSVRAGDEYTDEEIQQLISELGSFASQALLDDLNLPSAGLAPPQGEHPARFQFVMNGSTPVGLLVAAPAGARIGKRLQALKEQDVEFTESNRR